MRRDRDVEAFEQRAAGYERGVRGDLHREIVVRAIDLALRVEADPEAVLDVGCGTGQLLRGLSQRRAGRTRVVGVDPAPSMLETARVTEGAGGIALCLATAERLPFLEAAFDLVLTTTSFDHWADQRAGLGECHRVLRPGGHLLLADVFSPWLAVSGTVARRERARTRRRASALLRSCGFVSLRWQRLYTPVISAVTATR